MAEIKNVTALDCLPFENMDVSADVLQKFIETQENNIFYLSPAFQKDKESVLAAYDYRKKIWTAGRFVGEAVFIHLNTTYRITIKPRFGEKMLLRMLEAIYNIRITDSASESSKHKDWQHYIKKIIALIWLQKLANANLHGLPRTEIKKTNQGFFIIGQMDVRRSIHPYYQTGEVVSISREKALNLTVAKIISLAFSIIKSDFLDGSIKLPDSAQDAINQINSEIKGVVYVDESEYRSIKYKEIYLSWKPLVDFSWDIIKRKKVSLKQGQTSRNGMGFFIDMAEVWEQYLRALLKKGLSPLGWQLKKEKSYAYKGLFFQRELIPDLVFQKDGDVAIWDAKYKRMLGRHFDVDRSDFFQIHTYLQHHFKKNKVIAGGLLYPISAALDFENSRSRFVLNEDGFNLNFSIDGIEMKEQEEISDELIKTQEKMFINRVVKSLGYSI